MINKTIFCHWKKYFSPPFKMYVPPLHPVHHSLSLAKAKGEHSYLSYGKAHSEQHLVFVLP